MLKRSIKFEQFKDVKKSHMKVLSVISCGLILKILKLGPCHPEAQDGSSDQR